MVDELDTTNNGDALDLDEVEEKEVDDIDPSAIIDEPEEVEDLAVEGAEDPEKEDTEDPFGFGEAGGILDENGEFVAAGDDEDEPEDEISEDLF